MNIVNFSDYAPFIGKNGDCAEAIQRALADIRQADEASTLVFEKDTYPVYKDNCAVREYHTSNTDSVKYPQKTIGFLIESMHDLTIEGNGCTFMLHGDMMAFAVVKSKNIKLKNFSWDMEEPTTTQVSTAGASGKTVSYVAPESCPFTIKGRKLKWICGVSPYTGKPYYTQRNAHKCWCVVGYNRDTKVKRRYSFLKTPFSGAKKIVQTGPNSFDVHYWVKAPKPWNQVGMSCEMCASKRRPTAGAFIWESENVTCESVTVHYLHGFGWLTQMSKNVSFLHCNFIPNARGNYCTSYADLIHVSGAAGKIRIENCVFSHAHDDPINIHGTFTRVEKKKDDKTLILKYIHRQQGGFPQFHEGDEVVFYTRDTLEPLGGSEQVYTVVKAGLPGEDGNGLKSMTVTFAEPLPAELSEKIGLEPRYVAENITYTPEVEIRGCTFETIPTRGILCTTRKKVVIENNRFDNIAMACIFISNDSNEWYESGPVRDVTIQSNEFFIRETGQTEWKDTPAVYVHPVVKGGKIPKTPVHKNIVIQNNTVHLGHDRAFVIESVENLVVKNNIVLNEGTNAEKVVEYTGCKNVQSDL